MWLHLLCERANRTWSCVFVSAHLPGSLSRIVLVDGVGEPCARIVSFCKTSCKFGARGRRHPNSSAEFNSSEPVVLVSMLPFRRISNSNGFEEHHDEADGAATPAGDERESRRSESRRRKSWMRPKSPPKALMDLVEKRLSAIEASVQRTRSDSISSLDTADFGANRFSAKQVSFSDFGFDSVAGPMGDSIATRVERMEVKLDDFEDRLTALEDKGCRCVVM